MEIRKDICPEKDDAQEYLQALAYRTQEAFPTAFSSVDDAVRYVNKFKNPKIAKLFLDIGDYYHSAKFCSCPKCTPPKKIETCPYCNSKFERPAFIVLITAVSVMEKLASVDSSSVESWVDFHEWVSRKDITAEYAQALKKGKFRDFKALMDSLKARWSAEFGSLIKITGFLKTIMSPEEKRALVKSILYMQKVPELPSEKLKNKESSTNHNHNEERGQASTEQTHKAIFKNQEDVKRYVKQNGSNTTWEALPACYEENRYWNCYATDCSGRGVGYCRFENDCALLADEKRLDKCFKATVKTIYDWRSKFVHDVQLPPIGKTTIYDGTSYKKRDVVAELTITEFEPVFERLVKKVFDEL
ncbi:MAG: hypothetical protein NWF00_04660 [Candidatus Bathyarchaeota archaeon]|nr:hypothetical protein [Candidatus Bathyarchaeota archaeon]